MLIDWNRTSTSRTESLPSIGLGPESTNINLLSFLHPCPEKKREGAKRFSRHGKGYWEFKDCHHPKKGPT